jgi:hypothetical protein
VKIDDRWKPDAAVVAGGGGGRGKRRQKTKYIGPVVDHTYPLLEFEVLDIHVAGCPFLLAFKLAFAPLKQMYSCSKEGF